MLPLMAPGQSQAIIIDRLAAPFDDAQVNTSAPLRDVQFDQTGVEDDDPNTVIGGDPGWNNVPTNRSGIYLGNGWYLDARHALGSNTVVRLNGENYNFLSGQRIEIQNPLSFRGTTQASGQLSASSDLVLIRLSRNADGETPEEADTRVRTLNNPDPNRRITFTSTTHSAGDDVLFIGQSIRRIVNTDDENGLTDFSIEDFQAVDPSTPPEDRPPTVAGFELLTNNPRVATWGVNTIAPDSSIERNAAGNPVFDAGNEVLVNVSGRTTIAQVTRFDQGLGEAQAAAGDSGGPVFVRNDANEWELGGILHGISRFLNGDEITIDGEEFTVGANQPVNANGRYLTLFGNHTFFSDISNPLNTYDDQILEYFNLDFSVAGDELTGGGDVDLDGDIDLDDLDALAAGWNDEATTAGLLTWLRGDINQDGDIDLGDFALLREGLGGSVGLADLNAAIAAAAVNAAAIPEPATAWIAALAASSLLGARHRLR